MSDPSDHPSDSMTGQDNGLRPLSNADDLSLGNPSNSELSRIMSRAGIALANGFPLDDDEGEEEVDEDYVAVDQEDANEYPYWFRRPPQHHRTKLDELHPFVQLLSVSNVEDCVSVEAAFPEAERCSRDKVEQTLQMLPIYLELGSSGVWHDSGSWRVPTSQFDDLQRSLIVPRLTGSTCIVHLPSLQMPRVESGSFHLASERRHKAQAPSHPCRTYHCYPYLGALRD